MLYPVPIRNDQPCPTAFTFSVQPGADGELKATTVIGSFAKGQAVTAIRLVITQAFEDGDDPKLSIGLGAYTKTVDGVTTTTAAQPEFFKAATDASGAAGTVIDVGAILTLIPDFDGEQVDLTLTLSDDGNTPVDPDTWTNGKLKGFVTLLDQI